VVSGLAGCVCGSSAKPGRLELRSLSIAQAADAVSTTGGATDLFHLFRRNIRHVSRGVVLCDGEARVRRASPVEDPARVRPWTTAMGAVRWARFVERNSNVSRRGSLVDSAALRQSRAREGAAMVERREVGIWQRRPWGRR
jgi:hypothetical protein